jgi:hypothetical protein
LGHQVRLVGHIPRVAVAAVGALNGHSFAYFVTVSSTTHPRPASKWRRAYVVLGILGIAFIYVLSLISYALSGGVRVDSSAQSVSDGVNLDIAIVEIDPNKGEAKLRAFVIPTGSYVNQFDGTFTRTVELTSRYQPIGNISIVFKAGSPLGGTIDFALPLDGNPATYPFDGYFFGKAPLIDDDPHLDSSDPANTSPQPLPFVEAAAISGTRRTPVAVGVDDTDGINGWRQSWSFSHPTSGDGSEPDTLMALLSLKRGGGGIAFVCVVLALMTLGVVLAAIVASRVARKQRPIEATMASWFAALLFALVPLRINLPGAPPIGAWIDVAVFYWVVMALMIAMAVFVGSWVKYRKPPDD